MIGVAFFKSNKHITYGGIYVVNNHISEFKDINELPKDTIFISNLNFNIKNIVKEDFFGISINELLMRFGPSKISRLSIEQLIEIVYITFKRNVEITNMSILGMKNIYKALNFDIDHEIILGSKCGVVKKNIQTAIFNFELHPFRTNKKLPISNFIQKVNNFDNYLINDNKDMRILLPYGFCGNEIYAKSGNPPHKCTKSDKIKSPFFIFNKYEIEKHLQIKHGLRLSDLILNSIINNITFQILPREDRETWLRSMKYKNINLLLKLNNNRIFTESILHDGLIINYEPTDISNIIKIAKEEKYRILSEILILNE
ncbi:hypothetical protein [Photobacterium leiognathi]|uniref:hypothetical protein n=1 Tax=Photobacterium leiognathi TaxID=553611 RepID=UPI0029814EE3|nr:hypothetical protein [Photobacterium leiognathi]